MINELHNPGEHGQVPVGSTHQSRHGTRILAGRKALASGKYFPPITIKSKYTHIRIRARREVLSQLSTLAIGVSLQPVRARGQWTCATKLHTAIAGKMPVPPRQPHLLLRPTGSVLRGLHRVVVTMTTPAQPVRSQVRAKLRIPRPCTLSVTFVDPQMISVDTHDGRCLITYDARTASMVWTSRQPCAALLETKRPVYSRR